MLKIFCNIIITWLNILHNYFDGSKKLFSNLYLAKILDTPVKSFFPYIFELLVFLDNRKWSLPRI